MVDNELIFTDYSVVNYLSVFSELLSRGKRHFLIRGATDDSVEFVSRAQERAGESICRFYLHDEDKGELAGVTSQCNIGEIDAIFIFIIDPADLSSELIKYEDIDHGVLICAPITRSYFKNRGVFTNSIPKSGTHMLYKCLDAFGFIRQDLNNDYGNAVYPPGHYYTLSHMKPDELALWFGQMPLFMYKFANSVHLFIYRDPRDVAVSFGYWLSSNETFTFLASYMNMLAPEERLEAFLRGDYPFPIKVSQNFKFTGTIRDYMLRYANWIKYPWPNTIGIRFEDLVGPNGGGDYKKQLQTIWKLQIALHVPGMPSEYADKVFSERTLTFRKGKIGSYLDEFTEEHITFFKSLPQDFMADYGYKRDVTLVRPFVLSLNELSKTDPPALLRALQKEFMLCSDAPLRIIDGASLMVGSHAAKANAEDQPLENVEVLLKRYGESQKKSNEDTLTNVPEADRLRSSDTINYLQVVVDREQPTLKECVDAVIDVLQESGYLQVENSAPLHLKRNGSFTGRIALKYPKDAVMFEEGYNGYNLILFKDKFYGLSQALGYMDFTSPEIDAQLECHVTSGLCVAGDTYEECKERVEERLSFHRGISQEIAVEL